MTPPRALMLAALCAALRLMATTTAPPTEAALSPAVAPATNGSTFAFAPGHFSFRLPYYWAAVPDDKLQLYKDSLRKQFTDRNVPNYVLGIQRKALFSFSLPYALIELDKCGILTTAQIESDCKAFAASIVKAYLPLHRNGQFSEVKPMEASYDTNKNVVVGYWQMLRVQDNQRLVCVSALFPCTYGYARFHFFMDAKDQDAYLPVVDDIIGSVSFDPGFVHTSAPAVKGMERSLRNLRTMIGMLIAVMVVWLGLRILMRTKTDKRAKPRSHYLGRAT